jgi:serine/threonine-protein kinase
MVEHHLGDSFVKIVYAKVQSNGQTEFVPLKLYVDGSLEYLRSSPYMNSTPPSGPLIGKRYLIQQVLGQGGFGRTYLAVDRYRFNERCVLKEFLPNDGGDYERQKSRDLFEREAKILHQIEHPQIPKFLACFEEEGRLFLVQEYVNGKTYSALLRERCQQGQTFSEAEVRQWLIDLLPVLDYIHQCQIVHRDISPDNVMLQGENQLPVLIDFGVGKQLCPAAEGDGKTTLSPPQAVAYSKKNSVVGKIGYAPQEQICMGQCFPSSDLYALAVTAAVLLTGKEPERLIDRYSLEWQWRAYAQVSDSFACILNKMLQHRPSDRYPSAQAVLADLIPASNPPLPSPKLQAPQITVLSQPKEENVTRLSQPRQRLETPRQRPASLHPVFLERCQEKLIAYIGPIAKFVISEALAKHSDLSAEQLVDLLAQKLPQPQQATEFRQHLVGSWQR